MEGIHPSIFDIQIELLEPESVMWKGGAALQFIMTPNQKIQARLDAAKAQLGSHEAVNLLLDGSGGRLSS